MDLTAEIQKVEASIQDTGREIKKVSSKIESLEAEILAMSALQPKDDAIKHQLEEKKEEKKSQMEIEKLLMKEKILLMEKEKELREEKKKSQQEARSSEDRSGEATQGSDAKKAKYDQPISTGSGGSLEEAVQEILRMVKKMTIENFSVSFSKASATKVGDLLTFFEITSVDACRDDFIPDQTFSDYSTKEPELTNLPPMNWSHSEVLSTPDALNFINTALLACGASLYEQVLNKTNALHNTRTKTFKMVNVCSKHDMTVLTASSRFRGGIDGLIAPFRVNLPSFNSQIRVSIELKHPNIAADEENWQQALNQAIVQAVAVSTLSNHPVLHFLTDLQTKFVLFKVSENQLLNYSCPDLFTAIKCLAYWLSCCSSAPNFVYIENEKQLNEFLLSSINGVNRLHNKMKHGDLVDELKLDILDDLEPDERASYLFNSLMSRFGGCSDNI